MCALGVGSWAWLTVITYSKHPWRARSEWSTVLNPRIDPMDWGYYYPRCTNKNNEAPTVESRPHSWIPRGHHCIHCSVVYTWGASPGERDVDESGEMKVVLQQMHIFAWLGAGATPRVHPGVGTRLPPGCFQFQCPSWGLLIGRGDPYRAGCALGLNPALFLDSSIPGESREGKERKHKKFQHMRSICNVIYAFWAKLLYTLWGELQINDETFWNMAYT